MAATGARVTIASGYSQRGTGTVAASVLTATQAHPGRRTHVEQWVTVHWDDGSTSTERAWQLTPA